MSQKQHHKLNFFVDCSNLHHIPYAKIALPRRHIHDYIVTRADFCIYYGTSFSVKEPYSTINKHTPTNDFYDVTSSNVYAKPSKTSSLPEALLAVLISVLFISFLIYEKDFDTNKHFNLGFIATGASFIFGLFFGDIKIMQQKKAASVFNNS